MQHLNTDDHTTIGATGLIVAIIRLAANDLAGDDDYHHHSASRFFKSAWFEYLADGIDLDVAAVRGRLNYRNVNKCHRLH